MNHILLVEDDLAMSNGISMALSSDQTELSQCHSLHEAQAYLAAHCVQLVILDINLPDGNGLALLKTICKSQATPVILLTANDMETDIVAGLEMGADDYITKPFSLAVLRARVNTQLRKQEMVYAHCFKQDAFVFDFDVMEFHKGSTLIELSKTEQKLLKMLIEHKGITVERAVLVDRIWSDGAEYVDANALSVTIKRLRDKLESDASKPQYIKTVYGIGYTWAVQ